MTAEQQQVLDLLKKKFFVMHFLNTEHDLAYRCLVVQPNVPYHRVDGTSREFDVDFFDQELLVSYTDAEDSQPSDEGYSYDEVTEEMLDELIDRLCPTQVVIKSEINVLIFEDLVHIQSSGTSSALKAFVNIWHIVNQSKMMGSMLLTLIQFLFQPLKVLISFSSNNKL